MGGSHVYPLNWGTVKFDENDRIGEAVEVIRVCFRVEKRFCRMEKLLNVCASGST